MISPDRLTEIRQAAMRYGPANCWTGDTGTLAAMILDLLKDRAAFGNVEQSLPTVYGERCDDYSQECCVCAAWQVLDELRELANKEADDA